ncbi:MAG: NAD-dependent epimerase/dehydratase family protein [Clostridium sp.]
MKRIVLTGATSMLGVALINECIVKNTMVLAIIRKNSSNSNRIPKSPLVTVIECGLNELSKVLDTKSQLNIEDLDNFDAFYHFGWESTTRELRNNPKSQLINVDYTLDAVDLAQKLGCKLFIGAGSQAEYGLVENTISPHTSVNPLTAYGVSKYTAFKLSAIKCAEFNMKHVWTRIFSVYGPNDNNTTMISTLIDKLLKGEKPALTLCEQKWDYLYCGDAARAFYLIGEKGIDKSIYCIGSGTAKHLSEYITEIRDLINKDLPLGIGDIPYGKNQIMNLCANITNLKADTGFTPIYSFEDGIKKTLEHLNLYQS